MSRRPNCWENVPMESVFGRMETELDARQPFEIRLSAKDAATAFIEGVYSRTGLHSAIEYRSTADVKQASKAA